MKCLNPNCNSKECPVCEECTKLLPDNWQIMMKKGFFTPDYTWYIWEFNASPKGNRWHIRIRWFFDIKYSKYSKFLENLSDKPLEYDDSIEYCNNLIINEIFKEIKEEFK